MADRIVLVGGGGHAKVVIDAIRAEGKFDIYGLVDPKLSKRTLVMGVPVIGTDGDLKKIFSRGVTNAFVSIGSIGNCGARKRVRGLLTKLQFFMPFIVHPRAIVAQDVQLGHGTFVAAGVVINPGVRVGENAIINTASSIDHDCEIGDFVHVAPGATLSGGVKVGAETHIGTGAKVAQYVRIGRACIIGAGQTVRHDMADGEKSYGGASASCKSGEKIFIIAEAGVNHNGSVALAKKLIDAAKRSGADAIKFQTFKTEKIITQNASKAGYQIRNTGFREKQFKMLKRLELSEQAFRELCSYAQRKKITFISSPFDVESVDFLNGLGVKTFKIASGEITNKPLIQRIASTKKHIILSTGMSSLEEVAKAIGWIREVWLRYPAKPGLALLHCVSGYPANAAEVNLSAMKTLHTTFRLPSGYSDHTRGIEIAVAAAALGARIIEKHVTLDRGMAGPDHKASLEPDQFKAMVDAIRNVEMAIGDGIKRPSTRERAMKKIARKSLVAARAIKMGELIRLADIAVKRPGVGIPPEKIGCIAGQKALADIKRESLFKFSHVSPLKVKR